MYVYVWTNFEFCEEEIVNIKKNVDLQSQAIYDDNNNLIKV